MGVVHRTEIAVAHGAGLIEVAECNGPAVIPLSFHLLHIHSVLTGEGPGQRGPL